MLDYYARPMNVPGANTSATVPPRRVPRWVVILAVLATLIVLGGSLIVLLHPPEASFGWFAYTPTSGGIFPGGTFLNPQAVAGWSGIAVGAVLLAFCAGWLLGRRSTAHR